MKLSPAELKRRQVTSWIRMFKNSNARVMVSDYSYNCFFSGNPITKTLIVFPDEVEKMGVITIDKPLIEVEMLDIIKLYKRIKS